MPESSEKYTVRELETALKLFECSDKVSKLIARMEVHLEQAAPPDFEGNVDRARFIALLTDVGRFFGSLGHNKIAREFFCLTCALSDLDFGVTSEFLKTK